MIVTALLSSVLMLAPAPTAAATPQVSTVRVETGEVEYVRKVAADGTIVLSGREQRGGRPFRFTVKDGQVRGWVGNQWVSFPLSKATRTLR